MPSARDDAHSLLAFRGLAFTTHAGSSLLAHDLPHQLRETPLAQQWAQYRVDSYVSHEPGPLGDRSLQPPHSLIGFS